MVSRFRLAKFQILRTCSKGGVIVYYSESKGEHKATNRPSYFLNLLKGLHSQLKTALRPCSRASARS